MEPQNNEKVKNADNQANKPNSKVVKTKSGKKNKNNPESKNITSTQKKVKKKVIKQKNMPTVEEIKQIEQISEPQVLEPIYPDQSQYPNNLQFQNTEQVNKQYQLADIVRKAQTTINFIKALSTTVVKPVIIEEVTTRKPIIAPVNIKTPVNFFEGQPLSEEDLIIQNFFKDTTPVSENTEQYYQNYYSYTQHFPQANNDKNLSQSVPNPIQQQTKKVTVLTQSVQIPSQQQPQITKVINITQSVQQSQTNAINNPTHSTPQKIQMKKIHKQSRSVQYSGQQQPQTKKANAPAQSLQNPPPQQINNVNVPPQSVQYPNHQQINNVNAFPQSARIPIQSQSGVPVQNNLPPNTKELVRPLGENAKNQINDQSSPVKQRIIIKKMAKSPQVDVKTKKINFVQNQNVVVVQNTPKKDQELNNSLKPVEKVKNITINNTLKETYPTLSQKKLVVNKDSDEDDDEKMPRDSIRKK